MPGAISLMWHANTELYIVSKGRVESALSSVGVESWESDICDTGISTVDFCIA